MLQILCVSYLHAPSFWNLKPGRLSHHKRSFRVRKNEKKIFHVKIVSFISMNDGGKSIFAFKGFSQRQQRSCNQCCQFCKYRKTCLKISYANFSQSWQYCLQHFREWMKSILMTAFKNIVDRCGKKILRILRDHFHFHNHSKKSEYPFVCTPIKKSIFSHFQIIG